MNIKVEDGKYEWCFDEKTAKLTCTRHGQLWRDATGDGAILALMHHCCELQRELTAIKHPPRQDFL